VPDDPFLSPVLSAFRRVRLFEAPTPLQPAPRLSEAIGADVLVKRDDLTVLGLGGNKVRKLEYLLGRARADGCDTVVTFGALQSNHARQTAAASVVAGLRCELILTRAVPRTGAAFDRGGNVALDHLFGATVTVTTVSQRIAARGGKAHWIPPGGSDAVGTLGYVAAGMELGDQILELDRPVGDVVVAVSTGGTYAGLLTGLRIAGSLAKVRGVCVYRSEDRTREVVEGLLADVAGLLGRAPVRGTSVHLDDSYLGEGYGLPTPATIDALRTVARTEALVLDPVYTGKAAAALLAWAREGRLPTGSGVVFVHTGGAPGLGAYPDLDLS
jgi:D-cysteine desulfhydrase family pyridoxal phosphate-dependent enzyme